MDANTHQALNNAFEFFKRQYPQWVNHLFDEKFLLTIAAPLITDHPNITPLHLAKAWASQIRWHDDTIRQRRIEELLPAAAHFLQLINLNHSKTARANNHLPAFAAAPQLQQHSDYH